MEKGGQRSKSSVTFIAPLELDCEGTEAIPPAAERKDEAEGEEKEAAEVTQSPVSNDIENGEENGSSDQQLSLAELSPTPNIEGGSLQHSGTPPELT